MNSILKFISSLLLILFISNDVMSQTQSLEWALHQENSGNVFFNISSCDVNGNLYSTGIFFGTVDFDPDVAVQNISSQSSIYDSYISKKDPSGNLEWVLTFNSSISVESSSIYVTTDGVLVSGQFIGTVDFDPGIGVSSLTSSGSTSSYSVFFAKFDFSGNLIWAKSFQNNGNFIQVNAISSDVFGNIFLTGTYRLTTDFDPGAGIFNLSTLNTGDSDSYFVKLDANGDFIWAKTIGAVNDSDSGTSVSSDTFGNSYFAGCFIGSIDLDPGSGVVNVNSNGKDIYIIKLNPTGDFLNGFSLGGSGDDDVNKILVSDNNSFYISGSYYNTMDFNPSSGVNNLVSKGFLDVFLAKYDENGTYLWAKGFGSGQMDQGFDISLDSFQNIYLVGEFNDTINFNISSAIDTSISYGNSDGFVSVFDDSGNYLWHGKIGGDNNESIKSVCLDESNNVFLSGNFFGNVDLDPTDMVYLGAPQGSKGFSVKLSQCYETQSFINETACNSYVSPSGAIYTATGLFNDTIPNAAGCDSVITIDLTINSANTSVTQMNETLSAVLSGATYQWLDCNDNFSPIPGETNQSFTAVSNGDYSLEIFDGTCTSISSCFTINSTGVLNLNHLGIQIYPNPVVNELTIQNLGDGKPLTIKIFNLQGQLVYEKTNVANQTLINVNFDFPSGSYLVQVSGDELLFNQMIVKK